MGSLFVDTAITLEPGRLFRTLPGGQIYRVEMVNESRAQCIAISSLKQLSDDMDEFSGRVINISSRSCVIYLTEEETRAALTDRSASTSIKEKLMPAAVVGIPVAPRSIKEKNRDMARSRETKKALNTRSLTGAAAKAKANAKPKAERKVRDCACGCGEETMSYFVPGHDARFKGWLKRIARGDEHGMPKKVYNSYTWKKKGDGFVPTTDYKGEPYKG